MSPNTNFKFHKNTKFSLKWGQTRKYTTLVQQYNKFKFRICNKRNNLETENKHEGINDDQNNFHNHYSKDWRKTEKDSSIVKEFMMTRTIFTITSREQRKTEKDNSLVILLAKNVSFY